VSSRLALLIRSSHSFIVSGDGVSSRGHFGTRSAAARKLAVVAALIAASSAESQFCTMFGFEIAQAARNTCMSMLGMIAGGLITGDVRRGFFVRFCDINTL
jgi:hypothetical protein